jgi:hypothetical protein
MLAIVNVVAGGYRGTRCDSGGSRGGRRCVSGSHSCGAHVLINNAGSLSGERASANIGDGRPNNCDPPVPARTVPAIGWVCHFVAHEALLKPWASMIEMAQPSGA